MIHPLNLAPLIQERLTDIVLLQMELLLCAAQAPEGGVTQANCASYLDRNEKAAYCKLHGKRLHDKQCAHRNLTPDEILLLASGTARLQSVGLAAWSSKEGEGPQLYQAPEQLHPQKDFAVPGPATDIYQLAALLYALITGQRLVSSPSSKLSEFNSAVWPQLDELVMRATVTRPSERWVSMAAFCAALKQAMPKP